MILCGWCHAATNPPRCGNCGHEDPARPWVQRGEEPPQAAAAGRAALDEREVRIRYREAKASIEKAGRPVTVEALAEVLDRSPRTVREWRTRWGLR